MSSFPTTHEAITPAYLTGVLGRPVVSVTLEPLGEPYTSHVAAVDAVLAGGAVEHLVAKVRRTDWTHVALYEQEMTFFRHVAGRVGDCVPRALVAEMADDGAFLLLFERVVGRHVREGFDAATATAALRAIAQVHGSCWNDDALRASLTVRTHGAAEAAELAELPHTQWEAICARFPRHLDTPPDLDDLPDAVARLHATTLTHNDLHAENVMVDGDRVVFIDWQNATWSTPMVDVANLLAGCTRPDVQRSQWRALLAVYEAALIEAGGPELPDAVADYRTATGLLFGWVTRYLAGVSDTEASARAMLLVHWERVCTGVSLPRG